VSGPLNLLPPSLFLSTRSRSKLLPAWPPTPGAPPRRLVLCSARSSSPLGAGPSTALPRRPELLHAGPGAPPATPSSTGQGAPSRRRAFLLPASLYSSSRALDFDRLSVPQVADDGKGGKPSPVHLSRARGYLFWRRQLGEWRHLRQVFIGPSAHDE
jgi:hypothetical protein